MKRLKNLERLLNKLKITFLGEKMVDFFVDKILHNELLKKEWYQKTKDFIKLDGCNEMLKLFTKAIAEVADEYYKKNMMPKSFFKGNLKITEIADEFGILPLKRKLRICPFHKDTNPSLSLDNEKGVFNCFGCHTKGNVITFYAMLKKLEEGKKSGTNNQG